MKYVLEPMLFAFDQALSERELTDYLDELLTLDDWWDRHRNDMYIEGCTTDVLCKHNYYPTGDALKPLLAKHHIDYIQYGDVERIIVKMLNKSNCIESLYEKPLWDMKSQTLRQPMEVHPEVNRPKELHDELLGLLWHVFLASETGKCDEKSFVIITKGVSGMVSVEYKYEEYGEVEGDVVAIERGGSSAVNCKCSLDDFLKDKDTPFFLWKTAEKKDDLDLGVRVSLFQVKGESDLDCVYSNYNFRIQNSFYDDYSNGHYMSKDSDIKSTIQAVTDALTDMNMRKVHAIRTGEHGNNPPLVKQGYDAQRRDITTSIKLAYWKKGREFKIANMKEHDFIDPTWED